MKNPHIISLLLLPSLLFCEMPSSVSSQTASYNGNILTLQGDVEVDHALGKMCAGFAKLERENKNAPFSFIHLQEDVMIALSKRGEIHCERADLDFTTFIGKLLPKQGDTIHFTNVFAFQGNTSLSIESRTAEIKFLKDDHKLSISEASIKDNVVIRFAKDIVMTTNQANFQSDEECTSIFADSPCHIIHFEDQIDAQKVIFYPLESKILFSQPKGTLKNFGNKRTSTDFIFCASQGEILCGQEDDQTSFKNLLLTGDVRLARSLFDSCCATADKLSYFPETKTTILSAEDGKNVLFWDAEQDLSISAPEVHITQENQQNTIKGVGVVRFVFSSNENALLQKLFPFYKPPLEVQDGTGAAQ